jgi:hypothetical protein
MNGGQIAVIVLLSLSFGIGMAVHRKPREPSHFGHTFIGVLLWVALLWWGGFWS